VKKDSVDTSNSIFNETDPIYLETDVERLISIINPEDVTDKRRRLVEILWGKFGLPLEKMPSSVEENHQDDRYTDLYET